MRGKSNLGLTLYKRHGAKCAVHQTKLSDAAKRYYWECPCPIWITGLLPDDEVLDRQTTGTSDLKKAEGMRDALIAEHAANVIPNGVSGPTIEWCIGQHLVSREGEVRGTTQARTARLLKSFSTWCGHRNKAFIRDLTVDDVEIFRSEAWPEYSTNTRRNAFEDIRGFLHGAFRRGWISLPLGNRVRPLHLTHEIKQPFTDEEVTKILEQSERIRPNSAFMHAFGGHPHTFRLLIELMLSTGIRVGDAVVFDPAKLTKGERMWVYQYSPQKQRRARTPKTTEAYVSDALKIAIDKCDWLTPGKFPFFFGIVSELQRHHVGTLAYRLMRAVGKRAGIGDCRPHRLRDTFAVRCLMAGMSLEDVSRLLGHSSVVITERSYAAWTRGRKARLEHIFAESVMHPRGNAVRNRKRSALPVAR